MEMSFVTVYEQKKHFQGRVAYNFKFKLESLQISIAVWYHIDVLHCFGPTANEYYTNCIISIPSL